MGVATLVGLAHGLGGSWSGARVTLQLAAYQEGRWLDCFEALAVLCNALPHALCTERTCPSDGPSDVTK